MLNLNTLTKHPLRSIVLQLVQKTYMKLNKKYISNHERYNICFRISLHNRLDEICSDLDCRARFELGQLLHERHPLLTNANVEVEYVDSGGATELVEHGLDPSEVSELECRTNLGENLIGVDLRSISTELK